MLNFCSALLCLALIGGLPFREEEKRAPETPMPEFGPVTLPVSLHDGYLVVVRASIEGLGEQHFIIDTGSSCSVLHEDLAKTLKLRSRKSRQTVFGKHYRFKEAILPSLRLGRLRFENVRVQLAKVDFSKFSKQLHVEGLLGLNVLKNVATEIDYGVKRVRFGPIRRGVNSVDVYCNLPYIPIPIRLAGQTLHLSLDTGSEKVILYLRRVERKLQLNPTNELLKLRFLNRSGILRKTLLKDVQIGGQFYAVLEAFTMDVQPLKYGPDGYLGPRSLSLNRLALDFKNGVVGWD